MKLKETINLILSSKLKLLGAFLLFSLYFYMNSVLRFNYINLNTKYSIFCTISILINYVIWFDLSFGLTISDYTSISKNNKIILLKSFGICNNTINKARLILITVICLIPLMTVLLFFNSYIDFYLLPFVLLTLIFFTIYKIYKTYYLVKNKFYISTLIVSIYAFIYYKLITIISLLNEYEIANMMNFDNLNEIQSKLDYYYDKFIIIKNYQFIILTLLTIFFVIFMKWYRNKFSCNNNIT